MRKLAICVVLAVLGLTTPALAHSERHHHRVHSHHHPGCRSRSCDRRVDQIWGRTHQLTAMAPATASWFDDTGNTACQAEGGGTVHYALGFAHLPEAGWPCGARVRFCYEGRCVTGQREDSGPYVGGRLFDLNAGLKAALGCSDLCHLHWRRL